MLKQKLNKLITKNVSLSKKCFAILGTSSLPPLDNEPLVC